MLAATTARGQWNVQMVDNAGNCGQGTATLNDQDGTPHIFYRDGTNSLKHAWWGATGWSTEVIPSEYGFNPCAAIDSAGRFHIASTFSTSASHPIRYAWSDGAGWTQALSTSSYDAKALSMALDDSTRPHFGLTVGNQLHHVWYDPEFPGTWYDELVETATGMGMSSIAVSPDGSMYMAYYCNGDLKLALNDGAGWTTHIVELSNDCGNYCSLKLDDQGRPCIAYYDATLGDLRYAVGTLLVAKQK
jgi:hypothetical protein